MASGGKRKGRRTRSDHKKPVPAEHRPSSRFADAARVETVEIQHFQQYTIEGQIEQLGKFARATKRATGWRRIVGVGIALVVLLPMVLGVVVTILIGVRNALD